MMKSVLSKGEPRLFVGIAVAQLLVVIAGFGLEPFRGRTDYAALPPSVYVHAMLGLGWCLIAIAQPWLIGARERGLHRTLGWLGAALALAMVVTGVAAAVGSVASGRGYPAAMVFVTNIGSLIPFAILILAGIQVRRRSDWHRRLLACATIIVVAPGWARIVPMNAFGLVGLLLIEAGMLAPVVWGMVHDWRAQRRIHPAWYWGAAAIVSPLFMVPLAFVPEFAAWADGFAPPARR